MYQKYIIFFHQLLIELLRLSERQQRAIVLNDIRELDEINSYQTELQKNLRRAEDERFKILATWLNININSTREIKISELKKFLKKDEIRELKLVQEKFQILTNKLNTTNATNRILINRARHGIKEMIDFITNGTQNVCNVKV